MAPENIWPLKADWEDITPWVVHFTRSADSLKSILDDREIRASSTATGWGFSLELVQQVQRSASFTEVPRSQYKRIRKLHGDYGIVFEKKYLIRKGGARVWYVDSDSDVGRGLDSCVQRLQEANSWSHPFWQLTPFIQQVHAKMQFEWEREWRIPDGLCFVKKHVVGLVMPRADIDSFRSYGYEIHTNQQIE